MEAELLELIKKYGADKVLLVCEEIFSKWEVTDCDHEGGPRCQY